jgi:hypothetical protein
MSLAQGSCTARATSRAVTIAEIARRLGRAEGTVKAYSRDPMGDTAREVKARYR